MQTTPMSFTTPNPQSRSDPPGPITQSPSSSVAGGHTLNRGSGLNLLSAVCTDDGFSPSTQFYDDGLVSQAPASTSPTEVIIPAVTQTSPVTNRQTAIALFQDKASRKRPSSSFNPENIEKKHKSWKGTHNSKTSMMLFLREDRLRATSLLLGAKPFSTNGVMRRCYNGFGRATSCSYLPFNNMKPTLIDPTLSTQPLTLDHHRLLFEDFVELTPGTEVVFLVSRMNHFFQDKITFQLFQNELKANPSVSRVISGKRYFAFQAVVTSNPKCNDFIDSNYTHSEIAKLCIFREGVAIRFELKSTKRPINLFHYDFFDSMGTFQLWGTHSIERLALIQDSFYRNATGRVGAVVSNFIDELEGDVTLSTMLVGYYQKYKAVERMKLQHQVDLEEAVSTARMHEMICVENNDDAFEEFKVVVDSTIKKAVFSLYGQFSEFTLPIITQDMLINMENAFRRLLPTQYHCIRSMMGKAVRRDPSTTTQEQEFRERQWDRYAFYTFIQQCRLRNSHNFIWFSLINAASTFSSGRSHIPLHFGFSIAKNTMLRRLNEMYNYAELVMKSKETLNEHKSFVIAIFDNSQFNINKKFQQHAKSSNMAEATCRIFLKPTTYEYIEDIVTSWLELDENRITYLDQSIPSPYGMPRYELLPAEWTISDIAEERFSTFETSIDVTGDRVQSYYDVKRTMSITRRLKRIIPYTSDRFFQFSNPEHNAGLLSLSVCDKLKNNWQRTIPSNKPGVHCSWYHHILKTSYSQTMVWRGKPKPAQLLIPAVSPENETTNKGAANVIMSLLLYHGVVEPTSSDGANGDVKGMRLAHDYKDRHVMLVGDGLSQIRVKTFETMIQESSFRFKENFQATDMIRKALGQVIHVTGDLHGGRFHFLAAIYSLFYGAFIQFVQILLGWKRIRGSDVTKCYQQAAGLVLMGADEVEKILVSAYLNDVLFNDRCARDRLCQERNSKEYGLLIAKGYRKWLKKKQKNTTDDVFRMMINFVLLTDDYREFRMSLNTGDAVMIEALYRDFLPTFYLTKKKHYVEINFYHRIGPRHLQLVRINRTAPLYAGTDKQDVPMANWSLDGIIELIQKYYHQLKFSSDKGWSTHSPHVMLTNKALRFAQTEYNRLSSKADKQEKWTNLSDDIDPANNRSNTAVNCRAKEHLAIANYLQILEVGIEKPGRKYCKKEFLEALEKVQIRLDDEDEEARARRRMEEARSEDEGVMATIIDELFDSHQRNDEEEGTNSSHVDLSVELDAANIARDGEEVQDEDENNVLNEANAEDERNGDVDRCKDIVVATTQRPLKVCLANVNDVCFTDINEAGRKLMEARNPEVTRFNRQMRFNRKMSFYANVHASLENTDNDDDVFEDAFSRFIN